METNPIRRLLANAVERATATKFWVWMVVTALGWLVSEFIDFLTNDWLSRHAWHPVWRGLVWLMTLNASWVWLVIAAWIGFISLIALLDATATGSIVRERVLRLVPRKRNHEAFVEVERIKEMWGGDVESACQQLPNLLYELIYQIEQSGIPFAGITRSVGQDLTDATRRLGDAIQDARVPLTEVQERLGDVVAKYRRTAAWVNLCQAYDVAVGAPLPKPKTYDEWIANNAVFSSALEGVLKRTAFARLKCPGIERDGTTILLDGHRWQFMRRSAPPESVGLTTSLTSALSLDATVAPIGTERAMPDLALRPKPLDPPLGPDTATDQSSESAS